MALSPSNVVMHRHQAVFFCIPKVANTSIRLRVLGDRLNYKTLVKPNEVAECYIHWLKFALVRNPWFRLVSLYSNRVVKNFRRAYSRYNIDRNVAFSDFVHIVSSFSDEKSDNSWISQTYRLSYGGELLPDYIGRFENLPESWNEASQRLKNWCGEGLPPLPITNTSGKIDPRRMYDDRTAELVALRYRNDIENFGYTFDA